MSSVPIRNWSQVNTAVSNAGLNKNKSVIQKLRKINYRNVLQKQMEEHSNQIKTEREYKERERQKISKQAEQQKKQELAKKATKIKTEQWYQIQNLDLLKSNKNSRVSEMREDISQINQLNRLEQKQKQRKLQTRHNFELQNILNNKQIQIKNKTKNKQKQLNIQHKQMYDSYIEDQYNRQQIDRELWAKKYLFDRAIREVSDGNNYGYAYQMYLRKQMEDKRNNKLFLSEKIDQRVRDMNQTVDNVTPSPAFVGLTESFDRKKQITLIDRHLHFEPYKVYQKQMVNRQSQGAPASKNSMKAQVSLPQLKQQKPEIQKFESTRPSNRYEQRKTEKNHKQYTSYDFISGTHKTFFI